MKKMSIAAILYLICLFSMAQTNDNSKIRLFRFGTFEKEKPGVEYSNGIRLDVSAFGEDFNEKFFAGDGIKRLEKWLVTNGGKCPKVALTERYGSCIARPSKIVAIGLNYADHVKEGAAQASTAAIPREPVIFLKSTSALCGPFDNVIIPENAEKLDYEVELAVVIGKRASYVSEADAMNYVAGYTVMNDYSERAWQLEKDGTQWDKGKSSDSFAPLGPYMILAPNISNPQELNLWLKVNGKMMQNSNTRDMIFKIPFLISYASRHMTLLPGDVISTGTPAGVGNGQKPPLFLKKGDIVEFGVENVGTQKQEVVAFTLKK